MATLLADWDDADAAVEVGSIQAECAASRPQISDNTLERRYRIKHISGRAGTLILRTTPGPDPKPIDVSCRMGPLRDADLEGRIVRFVCRRLEDLRGKDFAPVRE